jgi:hypothetical protein
MYLWPETPVSRRAVRPRHGPVESRDKSGSTGFQAAPRVCAKQSVAGPTCHRTDTGHTIKINPEAIREPQTGKVHCKQTRWCLNCRARLGDNIYAVATASARHFGT